MDDHQSCADEVLRLRRGAHEFLQRHAARAWAHQHDGARWEILLPPEVAVLPGHQRFRVHARQEASRLATAQLYDLDPDVTGQAVGLGAQISQHRDREPAARAGGPGAAGSPGTGPPAPSGFVRWRDGIGYNGLGAPVVACHWGPALGGGHWLAWWADGDAVAAGYAAQARAAGRPWISPGSMTQIFGPLWYDHQELLRPAGSARRDAAAPGPGPAAGWSGAEAGTPGPVLVRTTLAAGSCPGARSSPCGWCCRSLRCGRRRTRAAARGCRRSRSARCRRTGSARAAR
jgi:hypothetical protein